MNGEEILGLSLEQIADTGLTISYIFFGVAIVTILVFAVIQLVRDFKSSLATIFGAVGIGLVFLIAYSTTGAASGQADFGPGLIEVASAGLFTVYALVIAAIVGIIAGEIWSAAR